MREEKRQCAELPKYLKSVWGGVFCIADLAGRKIGMTDMACNMMMPVAAALEKHSDCYMTYDFYPQKASRQNDWSYCCAQEDKDICIIITGLIKRERHFTLETVRFYGKIFPGIHVVVSTWESEDGQELELIRKEANCTVVLSREPEMPGMQNINYQKKSAYMGAKKAAQMGKKYVIRTRSDTRITANGILAMLRELTEWYSNDLSAGQKRRIILFNAYKYYPFMESQMFYFGHVDDMISFWGIVDSAGRKNKETVNWDVARGKTYREAFEETNALNYCMIEYARQVGEVPQCDMDVWWRFLGKRMICLPMGILRPLWLEYDYNHEESDMTWMYRRGLTGAAGRDNTMLDFGAWLAMRNGRYDANTYNELVDLPMT